MAGLLKLKAEYPDARLVVGNTEVGIEMKFKDARYPVLIGVTHIPELNHMEVGVLLACIPGSLDAWCAVSQLGVPCLECLVKQHESVDSGLKGCHICCTCWLIPAPLVHAKQPSHEAFDMACLLLATEFECARSAH